MLLQLRKSFKLLHPLFLTISCRFRGPRTSLPTALSLSFPFISPLPSLPRSLHSSSKPTSSLDPKLRLLHQESFSPSQVKLLQDNPHFLAASLETVDSFLSFLRAKGVPGAVANRFLTRAPSILRSRVEDLETKCKFFQDLGIETLGLQKILKNAHARSLLGAAIKTMQKHVDFLQRIGLNKQDIPKIVGRYPRVLCDNSDGKMKATLAFFEQKGLSRDGFRRLVLSRPSVFGLSIDRSLTEKLKFLGGLGLNIHSKNGSRAFTKWLSHNRERLLSGWGMLKNQGFSEADVHKMVMLQPEVLLISEDSLKLRIDYVKSVLNRDIQDVTKYPAYLCLSFENRIIPRFTFLNELRKKAKHTKTLSLSSCLAPSDEGFERRYGTGYGKWKVGYLNKQAGDG